MRWIVGGKAVERQAASTSQMGRFETELLATEENLSLAGDLPGVWIDRVHDRHAPTKIILDMDSSVSPTYGDRRDRLAGRRRSADNGYQRTGRGTLET